MIKPAQETLIAQLEAAIELGKAAVRAGDESFLDMVSDCQIEAACYGCRPEPFTTLLEGLAEVGRLLSLVKQHIPTRPTVTPPELAKEWKVSPDKILSWIHSGELKARNVSKGNRPRFVIERKDLELFRPSKEPPKRVTRSRRDPDVIQFYQ